MVFHRIREVVSETSGLRMMNWFDENTKSLKTTAPHSTPLAASSSGLARLTQSEDTKKTTSEGTENCGAIANLEELNNKDVGVPAKEYFKYVNGKGEVKLRQVKMDDGPEESSMDTKDESLFSGQGSSPPLWETPIAPPEVTDSGKERGHRKHLSAPQTLTRTAFRKLKQSNEELERQLEERKRYEAVMTSRLIQLTETSILKAKDRSLRRSVYQISSMVFLAVVAFLLHCNYVMLAPHFNAVCMAVLISSLLANVKEFLLVQVARFQLACRSEFGIALQSVFLIGCVYSVSLSLVDSMTCMILFGLMLAVSHMDERTIVACLLTSLVLFVLCFPLYFALTRCTKEAELMTKFLLRVIESDAELQRSVDMITSLPIYGWIQTHIPGASQHFVATQLKSSILNEHIRNLATVIGSNMQHFSGSLLSMIANFSNIMWAFTTFTTTLYYMIHSETPWGFVSSLSPLSPEDNAQLYRSMRLSTGCILASSTCVGLMHLSVSYIVLSAFNFEIVMIPSFASGMMAIMPMFGSYVVWVPVALLLWARNEVIGAIFVCVVELIMLCFLDGAIYSFIPGDTHYVGLSIAAGMYAYGWFGFIFGPLIVGITITTMEIYRKYLRKPLYQDIFSPEPSRYAGMTPRAYEQLIQHSPTSSPTNLFPFPIRPTPTRIRKSLNNSPLHSLVLSTRQRERTDHQQRFEQPGLHPRSSTATPTSITTTRAKKRVLFATSDLQ